MESILRICLEDFPKEFLLEYCSLIVLDFFKINEHLFNIVSVVLKLSQVIKVDGTVVTENKLIVVHLYIVIEISMFSLNILYKDNL